MPMYDEPDTQLTGQLVQRSELVRMTARGLVANQHVRPLTPERLMALPQDQVALSERQQLPAALPSRHGLSPLPPRPEPRLLVALLGIPSPARIRAAQSRHVDAAHVRQRAVQLTLRRSEADSLVRRAVIMVAVYPEHRRSIGDDGFQHFMQRAVQFAVAQQHHGACGLPGILIE